MKRKKSTKSKILSIATVLALSLCFMGGILSSTTEAAESYLTSYSTEVSLSNGDFSSISGTYSSGDSFTGWTAVGTENTTSTGMIIDVGTTFTNYNSSYYLTSNPSKLSDTIDDNKILMINSRTKSTSDDSSSNLARRGYQSSSVTLSANSYYRFSVNVLTSTNNEEGINKAYASVYVSGIVNEDDEEITLGFEMVSNTEWQTYYIYIVTGDEDQTVTFDLYLGSKLEQSSGVVFFDECILEQFSANAFYSTAVASGYDGNDNFESYTYTSGANKLYFVDELLSDTSIDMTGYNFDFEETLASGAALTSNWTVLNNSKYGHARIFNVVDIQADSFESETGYAFVGSDLSYNFYTKSANTQALALYVKDTTSYISVQSDNITIKAHGYYKITMMVKVSDLDSGAFTVSVVENDYIYDNYTVTKEHYTTSSATSTEISSNEENSFTNDYTEVSFYIKGHELYDTQVNLVLSLGSEDTGALGLVMIDDIQMYYVSSDALDDADNVLELSTITGTPEISNGYFNDVTTDSTVLSYPMTADGWTLVQEDEDSENVVAGVLYLYDEDFYNTTYSGYTWKSVDPGKPYQSSTTSPNNVYMFYNGVSSYQSITSSTGYTLSADTYYKLSLDYYTQSSISTQDAAIGIEIYDENGIILYSADNICSENNWSAYEIYFHTATSSSNTIYITIYFGDEDESMTGRAYIDNVEIAEVSTNAETLFEAAENCVDLTDYMLNLDPNGTIGYDLSSSTAYEFTISSSASGNSVAAVGGIVSGDSNEFGVTYEGSNLLVIASKYTSTSTLTSNYTLDLEEGGYYKLTFMLYTVLPDEDDAQTAAGDDHDCTYGVSVGLDSFTLAENLKANEEFTQFTIYFYASEDTSTNLVFTLTTDCSYTIGSAYLTDITFETLDDEEAYTTASNDSAYGETVFTSSLIESEEDEETDTTEEEEESSSEGFEWLLVPSLITGLALIIALVGWPLRKVKIKKIEKIKQESYDRTISVDKDAISAKAREEIALEATEIRSRIEEFEAEKKELENAHKEIIKESRLNDKGKITKDTEKAFKEYAASYTRLEQKIEILNEQLEEVNSADHYIAVERRIASEETKRLREEQKAARESVKEKTRSKKNKNSQNENDAQN